MKRIRTKEDVYDRCHDQADHTHHEEASPTADVLLCGVSPKAKPSKSRGGGKECLCNGFTGEHHEDARHRKAHQDCKTPEHCLKR